MVSAAPVQGATCNFYDTKDKNLGTASTSQSGSLSTFKLTTPVTGVIYAECSGGTYIDEATGQRKNAPAMHGISAESLGSSRTIVITPLTELVWRKIKGDYTQVKTAISDVSRAMGLAGVDISQVIPSNPNSETIADDESGQYAAVLAALSQLKQDKSFSDSALFTEMETKVSGSAISEALATPLRDALIKVASSANTANTPVAKNLQGSSVATSVGDKLIAGIRYIPSYQWSMGDNVNQTVIGLKFTNVLTSSSTAIIGYSSSAPSVASVDPSTGVVTVNAIGTTIITGSQKEIGASGGKKGFAAGSASYTLNVNSLAANIVSMDTSELDVFKTGPVVGLPLTRQASCKASGSSPSYGSSNPDVVTVASSGIITLRGVGSSTITAICPAVGGEYVEDKASYSVKITTRNPANYNWGPEGSTVGKKIDVGPFVNILRSTSEGIVSYSSSDPTIASVSSTGQVTLTKKTGVVTITGNQAPVPMQLSATIATQGYAAGSSNYQLTVSNLEFNKVTMVTTAMNVRYLTTVNTAMARKATCESFDTPSYSSSNQTVAVVSSTGALSIKEVGQADITATCHAPGGFTDGTAKYTVTVTKTDATIGFDTTAINLVAGNQVMRKMTVTPPSGGAAVQATPSCNSDLTGIATCSGNGLITGMAAGKAVITVKFDGDEHYLPATNTVQVTVTNPPPATLQWMDGNTVTKPSDTGNYQNALITNSGGTRHFSISPAESADSGITYFDKNTGALIIGKVTVDTTYTIRVNQDLDPGKYLAAQLEYTLKVTAPTVSKLSYQDVVADSNFESIGDISSGRSFGGGSCVHDKTTGLYWSNGADNLSNASDSGRYLWGNTTVAATGQQEAYCNDLTTTCNTDNYLKAINANKYCGFSDWRLPTLEEALSVTQVGVASDGTAEPRGLLVAPSLFFPWVSVLRYGDGSAGNREDGGYLIGAPFWTSDKDADGLPVYTLFKNVEAGEKGGTDAQGNHPNVLPNYGRVDAGNGVGNSTFYFSSANPNVPLHIRAVR